MSKTKPTPLSKVLARLVDRDKADRFSSLPDAHQQCFRSICDKMGLSNPKPTDCLVDCPGCFDRTLLVRRKENVAMCLACWTDATGDDVAKLLKRPADGKPTRKLVESFDLLAAPTAGNAREFTKALAHCWVLEEGENDQ
jgi:hypothetical protein